MNDFEPSSTPNAAPAASAPTNAAPSPSPTRPREATRESLDEDEKRIQTADLSKVKVW